MLNDNENFDWTTSVRNGQAKVCINSESFWVIDCVTDENGITTGKVANNLIKNDFPFGSEITFKVDSNGRFE